MQLVMVWRLGFCFWILKFGENYSEFEVDFLETVTQVVLTTVGSIWVGFVVERWMRLGFCWGFSGMVSFWYGY